MSKHEELNLKTEQWFKDRGLDGANPKDQLLKLVEEFGELAGGIARNNKEMIVDAIGDIQVVCIGMSLQLELGVIEFESAIHFIPIFVGKDSRSQFGMVLECINSIDESLRSGNNRDIAPSIAMIYGCLHYLALAFESTLETCLEVAYNEIKDRKGKLINGVFVKEEDLA